MRLEIANLSHWTACGQQGARIVVNFAILFKWGHPPNGMHRIENTGEKIFFKDKKNAEFQYGVRRFLKSNRLSL
ncbi:MAG: hypothetical protein COA96_08170 [SAR86 cluster bacterium]|uniref:Uncharacterized protein n=1 Tax=SAR86 cluster bacterium TaxID=2030880 RepID=A0A2A5B0T9_9GAMM|nr:MAG: hypothetical protein COA96_08170 [SAR86 cluster bacterium]